MRSPCTFPVKAIETPPALMAPNVIWLPLAAPSTLPWEKQPLWTVIVPFSCWPFTVKAIWNPPEAGIELLLHVPFHVPASPPPADVLSLGLEDAGVGEGVGEASGDGDGPGLAEAALDAAFPLRLAAGDVAAAAGDFEPPAFTRANAPPAAATAMVPMTAIRSGILARPGARATRPRVRPPPEPGPPGAVGPAVGAPPGAVGPPWAGAPGTVGPAPAVDPGTVGPALPPPAGAVGPAPPAAVGPPPPGAVGPAPPPGAAPSLLVGAVEAGRRRGSRGWGGRGRRWRNGSGRGRPGHRRRRRGALGLVRLGRSIPLAHRSPLVGVVA